jgi:hypothetical protein
MVFMNFSKTAVLIAVLILIPVFLFLKCSVQEDDPEDPCAATKLPQQHEIAVKAYLLEPEEYCDAANVHWADSASYMFCIGSVQKFYCDGTPSGKFDFNITYYPDLNYVGKIPFGQLYQFKFDNENDRIEINAELKAFFPDGKIFKSGVIAVEYYYADIQYDYDNGEYFVEFDWTQSGWTPLN